MRSLEEERNRLYDQMNDVTFGAEMSTEYQEIRQRLEEEKKDLVAKNPSLESTFCKWSDMVTELQRIKEDCIVKEMMKGTFNHR